MAIYTSLKDYVGIAPQSDFELPISVEQGLAAVNLNGLREKGLTFQNGKRHLSPCALQHRKAKGQNLSSVQTERAFRLASTIALPKFYSASATMRISPEWKAIAE